MDQKMVTWEAVQKENYLGKLERQRKDSGEEVLRKTAHRCRGLQAPPRTPGLSAAAPPWRQVAVPLQGAEGLAELVTYLPRQGPPRPPWDLALPPRGV